MWSVAPGLRDKRLIPVVLHVVVSNGTYLPWCAWKTRPGESVKTSKKRAADGSATTPGAVAAQDSTTANPEEATTKGTSCTIGARAAIANKFKTLAQSPGMTGSALMLKTPKECRHLIK